MENSKLVIYDETTESEIDVEVESYRDFDVPEGQRELSFYFYSKGIGWGAGGGEYIYDTDVEIMADGIASVMGGKGIEFSYSCGVVDKYYDEYKRPVLIVSLKRDLISGRFDFKISMLDTLDRECYTTVEKTNLTLTELEEYTNPILEWKKNLGSTAQ